MYGTGSSDVGEAEQYVSAKKKARDERLERERQERERLARLKREKEERARQARLARQRQQSASSRHITSLGIDAPQYSWSSNTVWYKGYVSISDGSHIYAKVERSGGCYSLLVGSNDSSIYGNCSNCSNSINSYWSCHANGAGSFSVNGNQAQAANGIVQRSR
jgi:hypothetical protein